MKRITLLLFSFYAMFTFAQESRRSLTGEKWQFKNTKTNEWLPASVPGSVHTDLLANGKIQAPFKDLNEEKLQWIENEDWDYRVNFLVSKEELDNEQINLVFKGLDTFAEVLLNGKSILDADNMFRTWRIPVKDILKPGENKLLIKFKSALSVGKQLAQKIPFKLPETPRSTIRKAQYQFGWDWGPRFLGAGVWKEVYLDFWNQAKIAHVQIEQKNLSKEKSDLSFNIELNVDHAGKYLISVNNEEKHVRLKSGKNKVTLPLTQKNPELWWPNGWGEAKLYDYVVKLYKGKTLLGEKTLHHGFRTVELIQMKDKVGKSFYFKVNGKPIYIKGTNWIPADFFPYRVTDEKYDQLVKAAADAHMNMIRVWGGGIYEDDAFYEATDKYGILVWQDFMFAGSFYPADKAFQNNVRQEVKDQVKRLENHPSIALWCGNNEVDEAIVNWGYQKLYKYSKADSLQVWKDYRTIFHEVIPNTLNELLPEEHIYWPSSPSIGWGHQESLQQGDSHYWGVWWGAQPFEIYNEKVGRFMSEYGFQGMPSIATYKSMFSGKPELSLKNPVVEAHQKHDRGWQLIHTYMERDYVVPNDFIAYDYVSQLLQARGMRIAIEAHRRNQPYNMGTLIWQLNDCWPVASWSAIDYLGNWKALQYQTVRSYAPQAIFAYEENNSLGLYAINDGLKNYPNVQVELSVVDFKGKTLKNLTISAQGEDLIHRVKFSPIATSQLVAKARRGEVFLKMKLKDEEGNIIAENHYFFSKPKDLKLPKPQLKIERISPTQIKVSTDVLAKNVYLMGDTHYSDNFFDLLPGESKIIKLSTPMRQIEVMSLWDTLQEKK